MRMAGPDIVLFVVGALLFSGATVAIVRVDGGLSGASSSTGFFTITWNEADVDGGTEQVASMRSADVSFNVNETDVTSLEFAVECPASGNIGPATFTLQVSVAGPNGQTADGSGSCGEAVVIVIENEPLPEPGGAVAGTREDEARENVPALPNGTAVNGEWTVSVSGGRGEPVGLPVGDPAGSVTLTIKKATATLVPASR